MARYISKQELTHRICNGFLSHDGYVNGFFYDIYKEEGINIEDPRVMHIMETIIKIIESTDDYGITVYPREYRGIRMREIRLKKRIRMSDLQKATGISASTLHRIEKGKQTPKAQTIGLIADALGVAAEDLEGMDKYR